MPPSPADAATATAALPSPSRGSRRARERPLVGPQERKGWPARGADLKRLGVWAQEGGEVDFADDTVVRHSCPPQLSAHRLPPSHAAVSGSQLLPGTPRAPCQPRSLQERAIPPRSPMGRAPWKGCRGRPGGEELGFTLQERRTRAVCNRMPREPPLRARPLGPERRQGGAVSGRVLPQNEGVGSVLR